jgi:hypothetical protein
MSQINSLRAYTDCEKLFNAATADPKGARCRIGTQEACINMRTRMHYFRKLDREANAGTYPEGHALHGTSAYDPYVVRIIKDEDSEWWLYVEPRASDNMIIEGLSEVGELIELNPTDTEGHEIHQIEDHSNG